MTKQSEVRKQRRRAQAWIVLALLASCALLAQSCGKKTPDRLFNDAVLAFQRGDSLGATLKCRKILDTQPDHEAAQRARMLLAMIQAQNNNLEEARTLWTDVIERGGLGNDIGHQAMSALLRAWVQEEDYPRAIGYLEKTSPTLKSDPEYAWMVQMSLGELYFQNDETDKAITHLEYLRDRTQDEGKAVAALEQIVRILVSKEDFQGAIDLYREYIEKRPQTDREAMLRFGIGYYYNRVAEKAEDEKAKEEATGQAREALTRCLELFQKDLDDELEAVNQIALTRRIAEVHREMGEEDRALEILEKGVEQYKDVEERHALMAAIGELFASRDELDKSREWYVRMRDEYRGTAVGQQAGTIVESVDRRIEEEQRQAAAGDAGTTATAAGWTTATAAGGEVGTTETHSNAEPAATTATAAGAPAPE